MVVGGSIPVLCYHDVDPGRAPVATRLSPRLFRRQMEALARAGWQTLGTSDLAAPIPPSPPSPPRVLVTFDDGYAGLASHAFPVLADLGIRASVFVVTGFVGREAGWDVPWGGRRFVHLGWDDLARWQERGIEVHSHGATHARLTWLPDAAVADELGRSRETLARRLGRVPAALAYPFGAHDGRVRRLAREAGYAAAFAGASGGIPGDPLAVPRLMVYPWDRAAPPLVLRPGIGGAAARAAASAVARVAVATSLVRRLSPVPSGIS